MANTRLTTAKWLRILEFLRSDPGVYVKDETDCRKFIEAVVWINRTGAPWRDLPDEFGKSNSVFRRFSRWKRSGVWERMYLRFVEDPDMENLPIDSMIVRAHPCADALGNPLRFILTAGQEHDIKQSKALIEDMDCERVIADKGYDSDAFREHVAQSGATAVIPPKSNRKIQYRYDEHLYKERHLVECLFNKVKHFRRAFSRYDKFTNSYLSFLQIAATLIWLK